MLDMQQMQLLLVDVVDALQEHEVLVTFTLVDTTLLEEVQLHFQEEEFPDVTLMQEQDYLELLFEQLMEATAKYVEETQQLQVLLVEFVRSQ